MFDTLLWILTLTASGIFVIKLVLMLIGGDFDLEAETDFDVDAGVMGDLQLLSIFSIVIFFMMGGWAALAGTHSGIDSLWSLFIGLGVGFVAMFVVAWILAKMKKFEADGTLRDFDPKGLRGEVYSRIPPAGQGEGKVRLSVEGRLRDFRAVNEDDQTIESFVPVIITGMSKDHVMRVRKSG